MSYVFLFKETIASQKLRESENRRPVIEPATIIKLEPGQKLFQLELATDKVSLIILNSNRLLMREGFLYAPAINETTARKKIEKMLKRYLNEILPDRRNNQQ